MIDCLSPGQQQERLELIGYAVDTLTRNPATAVYVDAGHPRWVAADVMAGRLNQVGVAKARGFSLNTANFFTTEESIGYGQAVSGMTNGSHFVIDTSRNGVGPVDSDSWCNPPGRALGTRPRRPPATRRSTPSCGSSVPVSPTDRAAAGRPARARSSLSTPSIWPAPQAGRDYPLTGARAARVRT